MPDTKFIRSANSDAAEWVKSKVPMGSKVFYKLAPQLRARAMSIAGIESARTLDAVKAACASVPEGEDWNKAKQAVLQQISPHLSSATIFDLFADPEAAERDAKKLDRRAENIMRINVNQAYSVAKTAILDAHKDLFTHRMYTTMRDADVRDSHAALDGLILPADHPFWDTHTPPWEFGCRCDIIGITKEEAGDVKESQTARPIDNQDVLDDGHLKYLAKGTLIRNGTPFDLRTPAQKQGNGGYEFNPRIMSMDSAQVADSLGSAKASKAWLSWAKKTEVPGLGMTVSEWTDSK